MKLEIALSQCVLLSMPQIPASWDNCKLSTSNGSVAVVANKIHFQIIMIILQMKNVFIAA